MDFERGFIAPSTAWDGVWMVRDRHDAGPDSPAARGGLYSDTALWERFLTGTPILYFSRCS